MYNKMTLTWQSGGIIWDPAANGTINFRDISPGSVLCDITTPWGYIDSFATYNDGECRLYIETLNNPFRVHTYTVKVTNINYVTNKADFEVLSYAHNDSKLKNPDGSSQLLITDDLPQTALPGSTLNYNFRITNNSPAPINLRYLLATNTNSFPILSAYSQTDCSKPLPPISSTTKKCWYDDWLTGIPDCQPRNIDQGAFIDIPGSLQMPSSGEERFTLGIFVEYPNYWPGGKSEWVTPSGYHGGFLRSVLSDPCIGIECPPDTCIYNPTTGLWEKWTVECINGVCTPTILINPDDPTCCTPNWVCEPGRTGYETDGCGHRRYNEICAATDYIEYDFSFLPVSFLNLVSTSMLDISNLLGDYLPLPTNIEYINSTYNNGKFRIYVNYTPPLSSITGIVQTETMQNLNSNELLITTPVMIPLNARNNIYGLQIVQTLVAFAQIVAGILIFILAGILGIRFGWQIGIIFAAIGAVMVAWGIYNLTNQTIENYSGNIEPSDRIEIIREYSNQVRDKCNELYPDCATLPPTCNVEDMKGYNKCVGAVDLAQYVHDEEQAGTFDENLYNQLKERVDNIDACLTAGTCTVGDAKDDIDQRSGDVNDNSEEKQEMVTCDPGFKYNPDTKSCIPAEECTIRNPFGGCILSKATAQSIMILGALLIGGYVIYSTTAKRPQQVILKTSST